MFNLTEKTAFRDFKKLMELGLFKKEGKVEEPSIRWMSEIRPIIIENVRLKIIGLPI